VLEYGSWNDPELKLWLANKGVGPAFIRHVMVTVDGNPAPDWPEVMNLLGPGRYSFTRDTIGNRVLSAGETLTVFTPHFDSSRQDLAARFDKEPFRVGADLASRFDKERSRIGGPKSRCCERGGERSRVRTRASRPGARGRETGRRKAAMAGSRSHGRLLPSQ
jgi:hypothetical protein